MNKLKKRIRKGEKLFGIWNGIPNTTVLEILADSDFDWIVVDGEHGPFDLPLIHAQLQAAAGTSMPIIVRPPEDNQTIIKQLMDIGVQNLLVPMVESAEQAQKLVSYMRYPPEGVRGVGAGLARAARWNRTEGYLQNANDEMCLIIQIETITAVDNILELVEVPNIDAFFIGPADLAASMGYLGEPRHPEVTKVIHSLLDIIQEAGKCAGILASSDEATREYMEAGAQLVGLGADTMLLANSVDYLIDTFKTRKKAL